MYVCNYKPPKTEHHTCFVLVSLFNSMSTFIGYLMPKPFF